MMTDRFINHAQGEQMIEQQSTVINQNSSAIAQTERIITQNTSSIAQTERIITQNSEIIGALRSIGNAVAGDYDLQSKTVTLSDTQQQIIPDEGYYGLSIVTVPGIVLQQKVVIPSNSQQTVTADEGNVGLSSVIVEAIPAPYYDTSSVDAAAEDVRQGKKIVDAQGSILTGTMSGASVLGDKTITANGTYDPADDNLDGYASVTVNVQPSLGTKTITENGTYQASSDSVDGYSEVTINVSGGGGAMAPAYFDLNTGYVNGAKWTLLPNTNSRTDVYQITSAGRYIIMHGSPGGEKTYVATFDSDPALATDTLNGTQISNSDSAGDWRSIAVYPSVEIEAGKWLAFTKNRSNTDGQQTIVIKIA